MEVTLFLFLILLALPEFALKKFIIQNAEQKELVEKEINNARRFNHPNLLPLLEYSTIKTTVRNEVPFTFFFL